jgi:SET domain-containing protein
VVLGDGRKPNAAFARGKVDGEAHEILIVRTIADVQANEELLVDYGLDYWTRAEVKKGKKKGQNAQHNGQ